MVWSTHQNNHLRSRPNKSHLPTPALANPHSQSFSPSYGSILPTSLTYFVLSTRGCSPWRPDADICTLQVGIRKNIVPGHDARVRIVSNETTLLHRKRLLLAKRFHRLPYHQSSQKHCPHRTTHDMFVLVLPHPHSLDGI
jgi:hypothetical protein